MTLQTASILVDEITDFLLTNPTSEQIIAFVPSEAVARRAHDLLERNRLGHLTAEERTEMEEFRRMDHFVTILKAKARLKQAGEP